MKNYFLQTKKRTNIYQKFEAETFSFEIVEGEFVQISVSNDFLKDPAEFYIWLC